MAVRRESVPGRLVGVPSSREQGQRRRRRASVYKPTDLVIVSRAPGVDALVSPVDASAAAPKVQVSSAYIKRRVLEEGGWSPVCGALCSSAAPRSSLHVYCPGRACRLLLGAVCRGRAGRARARRLAAAQRPTCDKRVCCAHSGGLAAPSAGTTATRCSDFVAVVMPRGPPSLCRPPTLGTTLGSRRARRDPVRCRLPVCRLRPKRACGAQGEARDRDKTTESSTSCDGARLRLRPEWRAQDANHERRRRARLRPLLAFGGGSTRMRGLSVKMFHSL